MQVPVPVICQLSVQGGVYGPLGTRRCQVVGCGEGMGWLGWLLQVRIPHAGCGASSMIWTLELRTLLTQLIPYPIWCAESPCSELLTKPASYHIHCPTTFSPLQCAVWQNYLPTNLPHLSHTTCVSDGNLKELYQVSWLTLYGREQWLRDSGNGWHLLQEAVNATANEDCDCTHGAYGGFSDVPSHEDSRLHIEGGFTLLQLFKHKLNRKSQAAGEWHIRPLSAFLAHMWTV